MVVILRMQKGGSWSRFFLQSAVGRPALRMIIASSKTVCCTCFGSAARGVTLS